jgi:hypothetical protein
MGEVQLPAFYEVEPGKYVGIDKVLSDPALLGRVMAQLKHEAERLEAQAEQKRLLCETLGRMAKQRPE